LLLKHVSNMTNVYTLNTGQLNELGNNMESGLDLWAVPLKLTQITAAQIAAELAAYLPVDADFNAERTKRQGLSTQVQTAQNNLADWLAAVKTALSSSFGQRWSSDWIAVGFITPTLEIPDTRSQQATLGLGMVSFLTKNPSYESAKPNVTAAYGTALLKAVTDTKKALKDEEAAYNTLSTQWDTVYGALTGSMWSLIGILKHTLAADDPRWLDFGLPMPATPSTPGKPVGLVAQLNADGSIGVSCPAVPLATRYRWRMRYVGVQADYGLAARSVDPMAAISDVAPGQTVELIVQAVNGSLQGVASDPVLFTVSVVIAAPAGTKAEPKASIAPEAKAATNGNGNGNGNGHSRPNGNGNGTALHHRAA
jgi:hypothetical protein